MIFGDDYLGKTVDVVSFGIFVTTKIIFWTMKK